ncbi:MAG: MBL fold metallo-hydrolase [Chloroflexi bacterium]|nr:MAG: MBL fold metallo-hydrolase [Chloroflexota bacterium]
MTQVYADAAVTIDCLGPLGPIENNAYLIRPVGGGPVIVVDAPAGAEAVVEALGDTPVSAIVVTHSHRDHWDGFEVLRAHTAAPVYAGAGETNLNPARGALPLADGTELPVGTTTVRVIATPGHTPGSICLLVGGAHLAGGALLTGDTLFPGGPGHSRTPEALQQLISSITSRLHALPDATMVLPGHGGGTTIGVAKAEYAVFAAKAHPSTLSGDVSWLES